MSFAAICTPQARNMVRAAFRARSDKIALDSHEIYQTVLELFPVPEGSDTQQPPEPTATAKSKGLGKNRFYVPMPQPLDHPIRSMKYLKKIVLENMAHRDELEKVTLRVSPSEKDPDGHRTQIMKTKGAGIINVPPEKRHPGVVSSTACWMWWYKAGEEQLMKDEPVSSRPLQDLNLSKVFESDDPVLDSDIKFEAVESLTQEGGKRKKPSANSWGMQR